MARVADSEIAATLLEMAAVVKVAGGNTLPPDVCW
jgi:hypothetical protein